VRVGRVSFGPGPIACLACGGKGYTVSRDYRGLPYPILCAACNGTGVQRVHS